MPAYHESGIILPYRVNKWRLMDKADTWFEGKRALRLACEAEEGSPHPKYRFGIRREIFMPLPFWMILQTRADNPDADDIWNTLIDSCTGIARRDVLNPSDMKILKRLVKLLPCCRELILMDETHRSFDEEALFVNYDDLNTPYEFDLNQTRHNEYLYSVDEVVEDQLWLAACDGRKDVLERYARAVFSKIETAGMGFFVNTEECKDELLRPLTIFDIESGSEAYGLTELNTSAQFLQFYKR